MFQIFLLLVVACILVALFLLFLWLVFGKDENHAKRNFLIFVIGISASCYLMGEVKDFFRKKSNVAPRNYIFNETNDVIMGFDYNRMPKGCGSQFLGNDHVYFGGEWRLTDGGGIYMNCPRGDYYERVEVEIVDDTDRVFNIINSLDDIRHCHLPFVEKKDNQLMLLNPLMCGTFFDPGFDASVKQFRESVLDAGRLVFRGGDGNLVRVMISYNYSYASEFGDKVGRDYSYEVNRPLGKNVFVSYFFVGKYLDVRGIYDFDNKVQKYIRSFSIVNYRVKN